MHPHGEQNVAAGQHTPSQHRRHVMSWQKPLWHVAPVAQGSDDGVQGVPSITLV
jgi:hypothetical protein